MIDWAALLFINFRVQRRNIWSLGRRQSELEMFQPHRARPHRAAVVVGR
jgi:hypothetical protein